MRKSKYAPVVYFQFSNSIGFPCSHEEGTELMARQGGRLEYATREYQEPKAKAPSKPRRPSTRVLVKDLPLTSSPAAVCETVASREIEPSSTPTAPVTAGQPGFICPVGVASPVVTKAVESLPEPHGFRGTPARSLTATQLRHLEQAERMGILTEDGCETLRAWRLAISRAELSKRPVSFISRLRRLLSPSIGKESK